MSRKKDLTRLPACEEDVGLCYNVGVSLHANPAFLIE